AGSCGSGRTVALAGMALMVIGRLSDRGETFIQEDCLLDMAGPGARYSPFATNVNLAVHLKFAADLPETREIEVVRDVGVRFARSLAGLVQHAEPQEVRTISGGVSAIARPSGQRSRVAYVCSLISEGPLHDTLLYGKTTADLTPRWIGLAELADGALISSDVHYSNQRTPTIFYQRNPIVQALLDRPEVTFAGVILTLRYGSDGEKRRGARAVAELALGAGISGLVTHPAVGGNAHVDALEIVAESEGAGIRTALVLQEMAGARGHDFGLVHILPEADALISTGNRDELVDLAMLDQVIGPTTLRHGESAQGGSTVPLRSYLCSTTQVGAHRLTTSVG
ncbi:MAG: glycine/sarcosine/betaine reductase component B subunit, partial [Acidimicrobiia bacterium]